MRIRPATPADAEALNAVISEGWESYRSFAPPGWDPPPAADELASLRDRLGTPDVWCELAEADDGSGVAGHVAFHPSVHSRWPGGEPRTAHFWQLFVRRPWWGTGLAAELHRRAVAAAAERGYSAMRLHTPAAQERARRFYEREGWAVAGEPFFNELAGLELVEYRRPL